MKKYIDNWMYGVGIGMIFYLITLTLSGMGAQGRQQIFVTMVCSGMMGLLNGLFDGESRPSLVKVFWHFLGIFGIITAMLVANGWLIIWSTPLAFGKFFLYFMLIYLIIWSIAYQIERRKIQRINENLRKKSR